MKKLLSYSIILMTLCALVSCSNDDDNDGGNSGITAKKLLYSYSPYSRSCNYIYNDNGKLEKADDMTYIWTDNSVEYGTLTALLSGDKILKIGDMSIEYSGDRRTKIGENGITETYKWDNDNITEIHYSNYHRYSNVKETYTYYPDKKGNGTIDVLIMMDEFLRGSTSNLLFAHPWLIGKGNKNLIKSKTIQYMNEEEKKETYNYTYEFDTNGNPIYVNRNDWSHCGSLLWEL